MTHPCMKLTTVPERPTEARAASQMVTYLLAQGVSFGIVRERFLTEEYLRGNIPSFMRTLYPLELQRPDGRPMVIYSLPDFLCLGSDDDFVHTPMSPRTAQRIANEWGLILGTPEMEDARRAYFPQKLSFRAMAPPRFPRNASMMSTERWPIHTKWFLDDMEKEGYEIGKPVTGHKKGLITHPWLADWGFKYCGIHGAYYGKSNKPIHVFEKEAKAHITNYNDYSHGVVLYHPKVFYPNSEGAGEQEDDILTILQGGDPRPLSNRRFRASPLYPLDKECV